MQRGTVSDLTVKRRIMRLKGKEIAIQFWQYDIRLGRRWNIDPVFKPWRSVYDGFRNNPIIMIDPLGDDDYYTTNGNHVYTDSKLTN